MNRPIAPPNEDHLIARSSRDLLRAPMARQGHDPIMPAWQQVILGLVSLGVGVACFVCQPRSPGGLAFGTLAVPMGIAAILLPFGQRLRALRKAKPAPPERTRTGPDPLPTLALPSTVDTAALAALQSGLGSLAASGRPAILIDLSASGVTAKLIAALAETQDSLGAKCPALLLLGVSAREFRAISRMGLIERLRVVDSLDEARAITLRFEEPSHLSA